MDYSTLFTRFGKLTKSANALEVIPDTTITNVVTDIAGAFSANRLPISGLEDTANGWRSATDQWRQQIASYGSSYLASDEILSALGLTSQDTSASLTALIAQMLLDSQSIARSQVTIGSPSQSGTGNGKLMTSTILDGINPPLAAGTARRQYAGMLSELAVPSETVRLTCSADSYSDRRTAGKESFQITGALQKGSSIGYAAEGSGQGPTISTVESGTKIINGDFESWSVANTPDSWTIVGGTVGTHIKQSTAQYFRDASSLNLAGDGALSVIELSQNVTVNPLGLIVISVWIKADASITGGTLTICFKGTGYTASSGEKITIAPGSLPTSWTHYSVFVCPPAVLPSDWRVSVAWSGTPQNSRNLWIDSLAVASPNYHGGVAYAVSAGNVDFVRGDLFTVAVANNGVGILQEFFRRAFATQLPSSDTPTISDSLAT